MRYAAENNIMAVSDAGHIQGNCERNQPCIQLSYYNLILKFILISLGSVTSNCVLLLWTLRVHNAKWRPTNTYVYLPLCALCPKALILNIIQPTTSKHSILHVKGQWGFPAGVVERAADSCAVFAWEGRAAQYTVVVRANEMACYTMEDVAQLFQDEGTALGTICMEGSDDELEVEVVQNPFYNHVAEYEEFEEVEGIVNIQILIKL